MTSTRKISYFTQIAFLMLLSTFSVLGASGDIDPAFNAAAYINEYTGVNNLAAQPDGKVLIGGTFRVVNGIARHGIARLNTDGTTDVSFNPPDLYDPVTNSLGGTVNSIVLQSTGKILVGGRFRVLNSTYKNLIRLNTDGSLDTTFTDYSSQFDLSEFINKVAVRPNDTIFISGSFGIDNGSVGRNTLAKLDTNGAIDAGFALAPFGGEVKDFVVQPDEKIVAVDTNIGRFNADGSIDNSFNIAVTNSNFGVRKLALQPDGKVLVGGDFNSINGFSQGRIGRLNSDGTLDVNFNTNGTGANTGVVNDIALASDGKIFIGGSFTQFNGAARSKIAKLNSDGTLDNSFTYVPPTVDTVIRDILIMADGKLTVAGDFTNTLTDTVTRLNSNGSNDSGFVAKVGKNARVREIIQQTDGKVLVVGEFPLVNGVARNSLARLNADGTLDTGFVPYFNALPGNQIINAVALQPDGKILVGSFLGINLRRLNADGSQDTSFVPGVTASTVVNDIIVMPNGQILIAGDIGETGNPVRRKVARLNSNGTLDTSFVNVPPNQIVYKIFLQSDGKILLGGEFTQIDSVGRGRIARLNADGTHDASFNPPAGANAAVHDIDVYADGRILLVGAFTSLNGNNGSQRIGRLFSNGSLDATFVQQTDGIAYAVKLQSDGKILIGGSISVVGSVPHSGIARLNANGAVDGTFNTQANLAVWDVNLQTDNKILLGGEFTEVNNVSRVSIARLLNNSLPSSVLFDYDGDGRADVSVFRPSTNRWYVFKSLNSTVSETTFGIANDLVAPADYDGDGKTDLAVFRPSSGDWWYLSSVDSGQKSVHWGAAGDIPRPGDFDGDGKADYIVFRSSNNTWYRFGSTGATSVIGFGLSGDKPVTGDFDGDGKVDVAIFRPSTGDWWWQSSLDNIQRATHWGISTDLPAPADYDGDGKTDFAVYRPSNGTWYVYNSATLSSTILNFGIAEDKPVPADYDGDGKADIAVFRPSTGTWYQQKTTAGFAAQQFGVSTDVPTENAFVP